MRDRHEYQLWYDALQKLSTEQLMCRAGVSSHPMKITLYRRNPDTHNTLKIWMCDNHCGAQREQVTNPAGRLVVDSGLYYTDKDYLIKGLGRMTQTAKDAARSILDERLAAEWQAGWQNHG